MGSCVSAHRDPESAMRLRITFGSKSDKLVIPPSPVKDKPLINGDQPVNDVVLKSHWSPSRPVTSFRDFGSKEEAFFDSQAWLESDCEDDFMSVKGDFTPSRGSTPVHHSFSAGPPRPNRAVFEDQIPSKPELSPTDKKKRLSDLFKESLPSNQDGDEQSTLGNEDGTGEKTGTPYIFGANSVSTSERTPNGDIKPGRVRSLRAAQCCLPRLVSSRSFSERKKMSPAPIVG
ncbi:hypothetical protein RJ640_028116 [Escallonia rubra]|uniref:Uncharacterized protein n=1 Tax=Escallonia rubra TaxID=112253 RepID=A0AA88RVD1_9ASTE|nr:hypothetical protein RJ640_028116 [Escallonia rubra]